MSVATIGGKAVIALQGKPIPTATLEAEMQRLHVPGVSIAVVRDGRIAWATPGSPTRLFVLSRELELHMAKDGSPAGRLHAGSFHVAFRRIK